MMSDKMKTSKSKFLNCDGKPKISLKNVCQAHLLKGILSSEDSKQLNETSEQF